MGAVVDVFHPLIPHVTRYQRKVVALQRHREPAGLAIVKRAYGYQAGSGPLLGAHGIDRVASLRHPHADPGGAYADALLRPHPRRRRPETAPRLLHPPPPDAVPWPPR